MNPCMQEMERWNGIVERWNGIVEWWNGGIVEWWNERLTTLYRFYSYKWANWACALAIDVNMVDTRLSVTGELSTSLQVERVF